VGLGCNLDDCLTDTQSRACGKIPDRNVEVNDEVVARDGKRLTVSNKLRHVATYHRELGIRVARYASIPLITRDTLFWGEIRAMHRFMDAWCVTAHN